MGVCLGKPASAAAYSPASASAAGETESPIIADAATAPFVVTGDTVIDTYGGPLPGDRKWLGAAVSASGTMYGVASHHTRVIKVTPGCPSVDVLPHVLPEGKFKYLRGIRANTGIIYGIPAWGKGVLRIDPTTDEGDHTVL